MRTKKATKTPPNKLMKELARRGPHKVEKGDLGIVGLPGQVFAPTVGSSLPAVAFGHGWMRGTSFYRDLMFHLAIRPSRSASTVTAPSPS